MLSNSTEAEAIAMAERVRDAVARTVHEADGYRIRCTVSAGLAVAETDGKSLDTLLRKADNALYLSKRGGRNRVTAPGSQAA